MVLEREAATSNLLCKLSFCPRQGGSCCCSVTTCRNGNFYQLWGILLVAAHVAQPGPGFGSWRGERDSSGQEAKPGTQQLRDDFRDGVTKVFVSMNWFMFWYFTYKVNLLEPETTELWDSFASQGYMELNSCFWFIVQTPPAWAVPPAPLQAAVTVTHSGVGCSC